MDFWRKNYKKQAESWNQHYAKGQLLLNITSGSKSRTANSLQLTLSALFSKHSKHSVFRLYLNTYHFSLNVIFQWHFAIKFTVLNRLQQCKACIALPKSFLLPPLALRHKYGKSPHSTGLRPLPGPLPCYYKDN